MTLNSPFEPGHVASDNELLAGLGVGLAVCCEWVDGVMSDSIFRSMLCIPLGLNQPKCWSILS